MAENNTQDANATKPFVARSQNYDALLQSVTKNFLKWYDNLREDKKPAREEITSIWTNQARAEVYDYNEICQKKSDRFPLPSNMPKSHLGEVIAHIENVRLISLVNNDNSDSDEDLDILALYEVEGPQMGTYNQSHHAFVRLIRQYNSSLNPRDIDDVIKIIESEAKHVKTTQDEWLSPVANGIYNRRTHKLEPFSPNYVFLSKYATAYNPNAKNVKIQMPDGIMWDCESQLDSFFDDPELQRLIRDILTAAVYPHHKWDKAFLAYSTVGNNGKGTICELIRQMLGGSSWCSISLREFAEDFLCTPLIKCPAVVTDENDVGAYIDSAANFKCCVTHDTLTINRKYKQPVKINWRGFIFQCVNEFPRFHDRSESMLRRFMIIPFEKSFKDIERKYIKEDYLKRQEVREYYLKIALENNITEIFEPQVCKDVLEEYRTYNDPLRDFFESCVENYTAWTFYPLNFVYEHYKAWYLVNHPSGTVLPSNKFKQDLVQMAEASGNWICPGGPKNSIHVPAGSMDGTELAIIDYDLNRYKNQSYRGSDPTKICDFKRPTTVRGALVRIDKNRPDPQRGDKNDLDSNVDVSVPTQKNNNITVEHNNVADTHTARKLEHIENTFENNNENLNSTDIEDIEPEDIIPPNPRGEAPLTGEVYRARVSTGHTNPPEYDTPSPIEESFNTSEYQMDKNLDGPNINM